MTSSRLWSSRLKHKWHIDSPLEPQPAPSLHGEWLFPSADRNTLESKVHHQQSTTKPQNTKNGY
jgi:hypothetical protein